MAGPYGQAPASIGYPSPFNDLSARYPNLSAQTGQASQNVMDELSGQLSPDTIANIQDHAAAFGVGSGMPGSGIANNLNARSLGLASQQLQQQGLGDFLNLTKGVSQTQTLDPNLQANIASRNALFSSSPDPGAAATTAENLYQQQLDKLSGNGGGVRMAGAPNLTPASGTGYQNPSPNFGGPAYGPFGTTQTPNTTVSTGDRFGLAPGALTPGLYPGFGQAGGSNTSYFGTPENEPGYSTPGFYAGPQSGDPFGDQSAYPATGNPAEDEWNFDFVNSPQ